MIVTVDCSAYIRRQCSDFCHEIEVDEPCTVQDFIRILADRWGESFRATVFDESHNLRPIILLSLNESQIAWNRSVELHDGDRIALLSPIAGGLS